MNQVNHSGRRFSCIAAVARALCLFLLLASLSAAQTNESKHVLILQEEDISWPVFRLIDENIRATLRAGLPGGILIFSEHLDRGHFPDPKIQAEQVAWIRRKYADSNLDLIIAAGDVPTDLFPGVPLVLMSADPRRKPPDPATSSTNYVSVWVGLEAQKTLELAQRLQPAARRIVVIGDGSPSEDTILTRLRSTHPTSASGIPITYVTTLDISEICQKVSELGSDSIVLFTVVTHDQHGHPLISAEVIPKVAAASGSPVYVLSDTHIGSGAVGGYVASFAEVGKVGGQLGLRLLAGEHPKDVVAQNEYRFDGRQLRRWKIPQSALPAGSVVLYRQPRLWESYKYYIIAAILIGAAEMLLILGLLWQRATRRKTEQSLRERVAFEKMLSDLSATFINLPGEQVEGTIEKNLARIASFLKLDTIALYCYSAETKNLKLTFSWRGEGAKNPPAVIKAKKFPWWSSLLLRGESLLVSDLTALPEEASLEREYLKQIGAVSVATLPLKAGDELFGGISFVSLKRRVLWNEELVEHLNLLAEIFSNGVARERALNARFRHAAIVESSDDAILSKNLDGMIMSWNAGARRLFGYSETEAVGKPIAILFPDELRDEEDVLLQRLKTGERVERYETVRIAKGGQRIAVSLTISSLRDSVGNIVGYSKIARDITDRKRAEQLLIESEQRFRLVANTAPVLIWMSSTDKLCNFFNQGWLSFTGRSIEDELGEGWVSGVHPEDVQRCVEVYSTSFDARMDFEMEYRLRRFDGEYRWIVDYGVPRFESDGHFCGYIGSCVDITERKLSAESLQALSGRLIHAQDQERARIARELHDDFSQSLALQCIDIEQLRRALPELEIEQQARLVRMLERTKALASDIRSLSHELHSSRLELIGLVPAVSGLCKEIGEKCKIAVQFDGRDLYVDIPKDVALCLFRVAQEALANVVKHSEAVRVRVELDSSADSVSLRIMDDGKGFNPEGVNPVVGIGLVGMTERLRLVGGRLAIRSEVMRGTEVLAEVPLFTGGSKGQARAQVAGRMES